MRHVFIIPYEYQNNYFVDYLADIIQEYYLKVRSKLNYIIKELEECKDEKIFKEKIQSFNELFTTQINKFNENIVNIYNNHYKIYNNYHKIQTGYETPINIIYFINKINYIHTKIKNEEDKEDKKIVSYRIYSKIEKDDKINYDITNKTVLNLKNTIKCSFIKIDENNNDLYINEKKHIDNFTLKI